MALFVGGLWLGGLGTKAAQAVEFSWNGFGSLYGLKPLESDIYLSVPEQTNGRLNFTDGSKLGLNIRADMGEGWSAVVQLVTTGTTLPYLNTQPDWKPRADWFYVIFNPIEGLNFKVGRQIFPNWLISEYIDVGFAYPWRQPPLSVYRVAQFKSFMGGTAEYRVSLKSDLSLTGSLFGGSEKITNVYSSTTLADIEIDNLFGGTLVLEGDGWRIRGMASRSSQSANVNTGLVSVQGPIGSPLLNYLNTPLLTTYTLGARYDKNSIVAYAEYGTQKSYNASIIPYTGYPFLHSDWGTYGSLGYRIQKFLPWYMFAYSDSNLGFPGTNGRAVTHSVGLDYQAASSVMVKVQYDRQRSIGDTMFLNQIGTADTLAFGMDVVF